MRYTNRHKQIGLSELDIKILTALERSGTLLAFHVAEQLSDEVRTSVNYRLTKLLQKEWVEIKVIGKRKQYVLSARGRSLFAEQRDSLRFVLFANLEDLLKAVRVEISRSHKYRLYFIEPTSAVMLIEAQGDKYYDLQALIESTSRVAEGVIGSSVPSHMADNQLQALKNRLFEVYVVPDEQLATTDIIWITGDVTFIINLERTQFRAVYDQSFATSMKALVGSLKLLGQRFSVRNYLADRK